MEKKVDDILLIIEVVKVGECKWRYKSVEEKVLGGSEGDKGKVKSEREEEEEENCKEESVVKENFERIEYI